MGAGKANEEGKQSVGKHSANPGGNCYSSKSEQRKRQDHIL